MKIRNALITHKKKVSINFTTLPKNEISNNNQLLWIKRLKNIKSIYYIVPPLIVMLILLLVYFLKGIYPFGNLTVVYGDMDQHYIPFSYHIYDVFYNGKSLFWDPFLGTGSNIFGIEALSGMFSPVSWLVIFTKRENIPYFASFLLLIRLSLLSITASIFFRKTFHQLNHFWWVALSLMYAFCGYALIFYTNMVWLDCAILFPLLLLAYRRLLDGKGILGYLVVLGAYLVVSYYISFMILLFLFFSSGVLLHYYVEKSRRKNVVLTLGIGTMGALLITSPVTVPAFIQSMNSIRFGGFSYWDVIGTDAGSSVTWNKAVFFFFSAAMLVVFIKLLLSFRKNRKAVTIFIILTILFAIQVIVEATNMLWYGGSYVCYPLRFGFIPIFLLLSASAYYLSRPIPDTKKAANILFQCFSGLLVVASAVYAVYLGNTLGNGINKTLHGFWGIGENLAALFLASLLLYAISVGILLMWKDGKIKYILLGLVILAEIFTHSMWYIGVPPRSAHLDDWSNVANTLRTDLNIGIGQKSNSEKATDNKADNSSDGTSDNATFSAINDPNKAKNNAANNSAINESIPDSLIRYKEADTVLNANYPLVLGVPAISSYLHVIEGRQQQAFQKLGYSTDYTRLLDTGGTMFSDMILGINRILTTKTPNTSVYNFLGKSNGFNLYERKSILPFGIVFEPAGGSTDLIGQNALQNQNFLFRILFHQSRSLIDFIQTEPVTKNVNTYHNGDSFQCDLDDNSKTGSLLFETKIEGQGNLYLGATWVSSPIQVKVNGQIIPVPTLGNIQNIDFPASFNNGILDLGFYENKDVKIEIMIKKSTRFEGLSIGVLPMKTLDDLSKTWLTQSMKANPEISNAASKINSTVIGSVHNTDVLGNRITLTADTDQTGAALFYPVNYDKSWKCRVNGKTVQLERVFETFIQIPLSKGENTIELEFIPTGFEMAKAVSIVTIFILILGLYWSTRKKSKTIETKAKITTENIASIDSENFMTCVEHKMSENISCENVYSENENSKGGIDKNAAINHISKKHTSYKTGASAFDINRPDIKKGGLLAKLALGGLYAVYWIVYFAALLFVYIIPLISFILRNLQLLFGK